MKEPVTTRCDHIFCRFCMLQLLSKKKKSRAQCPMCKKEISKRSLQDSPRFRLLTEGLMKIINAFELDSGYKFLPSQECPKSKEVTCNEQTGKPDQTVVQSTGYRNRKKRTLSNGDYSALLDTNTAIDHISSQNSHKRQKQETKQVLIKFVSDSSEDDLLKKADSLGSQGYGQSELGEGIEDTAGDHSELPFTDEMTTLKADAEEIVASDLAEYGFSERDLESTRSNLCLSGLRTLTESLAENRTIESSDHLISDNELCERENEQTVTVKLNTDSPCDNDHLFMEERYIPQDCGSELSFAVSKKRMKRSIQRVNDWLSKNKEVLNCVAKDDDALLEVCSLEHKDASENMSCTSDETEIMPNLEVEQSKAEITTKPPFNVEDKIFGKVYKREKKSTHNISSKPIPDVQNDLVTETVKGNEMEKVNNLKLKRKAVKGLQPEDFIKRVDETEVNKCVNGTSFLIMDNIQSEEINDCQAGKMVVKDLEMADSRKIGKETGYQTLKSSSNTNDSKTKRGKNCQQKSKLGKKLSTRSSLSLTLADVEGSGSFNETELHIESFPSSEETKKQIKPRNIRRSKRLQLLPEDFHQETATISSRQEEAGNECNNQNQDTSNNASNKKAENIDNHFYPINTIGSDKCDTQISSLLFQNQTANVVQSSCNQVDTNTNLPRDDIQSSGSNNSANQFARNNGEDCWEPAQHVAVRGWQESMEIEDSELDTESLLKTFKSAKRMSFILEPSTITESKENFEKNIGLSSIDNNLHTPETTVMTSRRPQTSINLNMSDHEKVESNNFNSDSSIVAATEPYTTNTINQNNEKQPLSHELGDMVAKTRNVKYRRSLRNKKNISLSPHNVVASSVPNACSQTTGFSNIVENSVQTNALNTANTIVTTECILSDSATLSKNMEFVLHSETGSVVSDLIVTPAAASHRDTRSETDHGENEQAKRDCFLNYADEEQINQITHCNESHGSVVGKLESHAGKSTEVYSDLTVGLQSNTLMPEENTNFCEVVETSFVFGKDKKSSNLTSSLSSSQSQTNFKRRRCRPQKLKSSDEESSEDDELPCIQALLNAKPSVCSSASGYKNSSPRSSPRQQGGALTMFSSSSVSGKTHPSNTILNTAFPTLSQESECSINLFSSQSNTSDHSVNHRQRKTHRKSGETSQWRDEVQKVEEEGIFDEKSVEDKFMEQNLAEVSGCDSEASHTGDSSGLSSQGEILSTQQRDAMQNNLKKLQQEMAALEAVLQQHGTQEFRSKEGCLSPADSVTIRQQKVQEKQTDNVIAVVPSLITEKEEQTILNGSCQAEQQNTDSDLQCANSTESPTPPPTPSQPKQRKETPEKVRLSISLLKELQDSVLTQEKATHMEEPSETTHSVPEPANVTPKTKSNQNKTPPKNRQRHKRLKSATEMSTSKKVSSVSSAAEPMCFPRPVNKISGRSASPTFASPIRSRAAAANFKSPVVSSRKNFSLVASGISPSEMVLIQKFAKKTQSTLTNQILDSTTHVIIKTDADLVCERTLKYFLGIAGRKWVVSYQWIVQSFKEGRILDEYDFEVKGDVINGKNHRGPRRSRLGSDGLLLKDFEICCHGLFTDLNTDQLEWMVTLCGASLVKDPQHFKHSLKSLVIVQPDSCLTNTDYEAFRKKFRATVVVREWLLDSVSSYKLQPFDGYLV
ncbi:breast cancer type 1 susceptibility protein [Bombina bombina]|uniref:breast cancer type 1 susceptibility protein n=1 Tax=Bombina bombina TaxID=8345 RepID=UPI00235A7ABE|nr:breast cancer type 1 susceptibility protein [Bombina bombina]